ncbi:Leucine-rich repeat-containing protein [Cynara cardunculus var. scolymus]|uniref:Leucine-rich repeat-containing protein n=1 Tax=Cynara cardunculus var. scolymus TaxID=59895 RepID=A0A118GIC1_CYNCS|nr:Leucine-rich repeat-containing protein [Cynara cardunculus var. scolymus]
MLKHLKSLSLYDCELLEKLPEDLGRLECLKMLKLARCLVLRDIPNSICRLKRLKYLSLHDSIRVEKLPEELGRLECLEELDIRGTSITNLPPSISLLGGLKIVRSEDGTTTTTTTGGCCTVLDVMFMKLSYKNGLSSSKKGKEISREFTEVTAKEKKKEKERRGCGKNTGLGLEGSTFGQIEGTKIEGLSSGFICTENRGCWGNVNRIIWNYHDEAAAQEAAQKQQPRLAVFWDRLEKLSSGRRGREPEDRNRKAEPETKRE